VGGRGREGKLGFSQREQPRSCLPLYRHKLRAGLAGARRGDGSAVPALGVPRPRAALGERGAGTPSPAAAPGPAAPRRRVPFSRDPAPRGLGGWPGPSGGLTCVPSLTCQLGPSPLNPLCAHSGAPHPGRVSRGVLLGHGGPVLAHQQLTPSVSSSPVPVPPGPPRRSLSPPQAPVPRLVQPPAPHGVSPGWAPHHGPVMGLPPTLVAPCRELLLRRRAARAHIWERIRGRSQLCFLTSSIPGSQGVLPSAGRPRRCPGDPPAAPWCLGFRRGPGPWRCRAR